VDLTSCTLCPRNCRVDRLNGQPGFCRVTGPDILLSRAALHFYEEPCISGTEGSGAVFFCGCNLHCVFCQNRGISGGLGGKPVTVERLSEIFLELQGKGANNLNLVTPTHYAVRIREALLSAKVHGLTIPVAWNCGGYEKEETLREMEGLIDIYLTDFKYMDPELAGGLSGAADYPDRAKEALREMVRQIPEAEFDGRGMMKRGVIVRELLLPGHVKNSKAVTEYLYSTYGDSIWLSLMNQYTPFGTHEKYPELNRRVTAREYERFLDHALSIGVKNAFIQEGKTADESFVPAFDFEGV